MDDIFAKLFGYGLAFFVFILVIIAIVTQYQGAIEDQVEQKTESFIDECRETGQIDANAFARVNNIITTYGHYKMTFKIEKIKHYARVSGTTPDNTRIEARTGYEAVDTVHSTGALVKSAGKIVKDNRSFYKKMIDGDIYKLKTGDRIFIKVQEGKGNFATRMRNFLFNADTSQTVLVEYGGAVGE